MVGDDKIMLLSGIFMLPSKFGYIITGRCPDCDNQDRSSSTLLVATEYKVSSNQSFYCSVNVSLIKIPDLQKFWCLETTGIKDPMSKESDEEAIDRFCKTIKFEDGRYQVTWPENQIVFVYLIILVDNSIPQHTKKYYLRTSSSCVNTQQGYNKSAHRL